MVDDSPVIAEDVVPTTSLGRGSISKPGFGNETKFHGSHYPQESWNLVHRVPQSSQYNPAETISPLISNIPDVDAQLRRLPTLALKNGYFSNGYVQAGTIDLLAKFCSFEDALRVFQDVLCENVLVLHLRNFSLKKSLKDVAIENEFEKRLLVGAIPSVTIIEVTFDDIKGLERVDDASKGPNTLDNISTTLKFTPKEAHLHQFMDMKMASKDLDILLLCPINSSGKIW
ncbi:hypothetical protein PVL29_000994 [Vitis rotundifolia]|uniref:Uncharacterized protein n=1 Tax=Vitis rotundifolia TaxID=103349 RepID=A0AA39ALK6_VITRO|nr:hypothetical protein PVL29_000994 [Vitis rotundifolia]